MYSIEWFDESSKMWLLNKRKMRNCVYKYRCNFIISNYGKKCNKDVYKTSNFCVKHWAKSDTKEMPM
jgi:hypothetical protein